MSVMNSSRGWKKDIGTSSVWIRLILTITVIFSLEQKAPWEWCSFTPTRPRRLKSSWMEDRMGWTGRRHSASGRAATYCCDCTRCSTPNYPKSSSLPSSMLFACPGYVGFVNSGFHNATMVFGEEVDFYSWQDPDNAGMEARCHNETVDQLLSLLLGKRRRRITTWYLLLELWICNTTLPADDYQHHILGVAWCRVLRKLTRHHQTAWHLVEVKLETVENANTSSGLCVSVPWLTSQLCGKLDFFVSTWYPKMISQRHLCSKKAMLVGFSGLSL